MIGNKAAAHPDLQIGAELTDEHLEPAIGTLVEDSIGDLWLRRADKGWVFPDAEIPPETWTTIAGDLGPVLVVALPEGSR